MTSSETVPKTTDTSISVCSTKIKKTDTCFNSEEYVKKMEVKIGSTNRQPTTKKKINSQLSAQNCIHNRWKEDTTGNNIFAKCINVCQVYFIGHSANKLFAECCKKHTRQNNDTRQTKLLPSAEKKTLGKLRKSTQQNRDTRQKTATWTSVS